MKKDLKIGVSSLIPSEEDLGYNYEIIANAIKKNPTLDLVCFSELFLCSKMSMINTIEKEEKLIRYTNEIKELAKIYNTAVSYGLIIKKEEQYYIGQRVALPNGVDYLYCKVHLGKNERKIFSAGNKIDVFKFKEYTFGIQICLDTHIMDMSIMQKEQGAEIIIAPFKTPYDSQKRAKNWSKYMLARAYECNFCMICSNYYGGIQIVNGNGICVKENLKNNSFLVYTVSQENDFNKKIDYFSYRKPELY
ncbi:nitrilase-related carbon-nitrogen hydrolase [Acetobacterium carbinolicum]|jgi:predicted amidohydrolase|uniref:nitrilase-related carbon-nitrogen hydrolase n=1 Tax=Acetobacterium TaxID=33951 RepID=UPI000DBEAC43|nr:nitrilase-related carbon-nitrogen hydrolase [Acetobacterium sp. KB-1]AWW25857.1 hypothetical protein DOZ58_03890 [Acetobacterium sp. KB-1]